MSEFDFDCIIQLLKRGQTQAERKDGEGLIITVKSLKALLRLETQNKSPSLPEKVALLSQLVAIRKDLSHQATERAKPAPEPAASTAASAPFVAPPAAASAAAPAPVATQSAAHTAASKQTTVVAAKTNSIRKCGFRLAILPNKTPLDHANAESRPQAETKSQFATEPRPQAKAKAQFATVVAKFEQMPLFTGVVILKEHINALKGINLNLLKQTVGSISVTERIHAGYEFDADCQIRSGMTSGDIEKLSLLCQISWHPEFDSVLQALSSNTTDNKRAALAKAKAEAALKDKSKSQAESKHTKRRKPRFVLVEGWNRFSRPTSSSTSDNTDVPHMMSDSEPEAQTQNEDCAASASAAQSLEEDAAQASDEDDAESVGEFYETDDAPAAPAAPAESTQ
jgi:hypothetical protein